MGGKKNISRYSVLSLSPSLVLNVVQMVCVVLPEVKLHKHVFLKTMLCDI